MGAAVNLPSPQVLLQNTNGLFYSIGVEQEMEFPAVYGGQMRLQREQVNLATQSLVVAEQDRKYLLHLYYAELQYRYLLWGWREKQDSIYAVMAVQAERQRAAGEVDFLQATYAKTAQGERKAALEAAKGEYLGLMNKLQRLTGVNEDFVPDMHGMGTMTAAPMEKAIGNNAELGQVRQQVALNKADWRLEKLRLLPTLKVGFMNNGDRTTSFGNWVYGGLGVPLWLWQNKSRIAAAKQGISLAEEEVAAKEEELEGELSEAISKAEALTASLATYQTQVLPDAQALAESSSRMLLAGMQGYPDHLRTLAEVENIQLGYYEAWKTYRLNNIYIQYLCGAL